MISTLTKHEFTANDGSLITIRPVEHDDAGNIIQAVREIIETGTFIQKEEPRTIAEEEQFIQDMKKKDNMYIAILRNNEIVGIARVIRGELAMKNHVGLFRTWLVASAQGLGIGKLIMEYTLKWCMAHKLHKLCLTVFASNQVAFALYQKYGFVEEGRQKDQVILNGSFDDEILMAYFLTKN
ncbi:GNAT family N-acetyltransferase [Bacillus sp. PS06]|uniref:GNAT family N-acetyltransferase n=1 Tax=Bacillus sp. PS06 TaxID=2764176 RepID=UPI00178173FA|nr:GNAT family protein [Bacillus sp. PS06]MBD8068159.1 GNAT family N-acetyltransferase [Bacillus sp. PS06]